MKDEVPPPPPYDEDGIPKRIRANRERLEKQDRDRLLDHAAHLEEIQRHREWRVEELEHHTANVESRLAGLLEHVPNVEHERDEAIAHARNLEQQLAERNARLADLEAHVRNLERRIPPRPTRLVEPGSERIFPRSPDARTDALFRAGERVRSGREDLRERFGAEAAADFWYWLLWNGPRVDDAVRAALPPLPEPHLMGRVVGEQGGGESYLQSGIVDWWSIEGSLRRAGFDPTRGGRILDFGCGSGRILTLFSLYADRCQLHGADVDAEAVAWCQSQLGFARFTALAHAPPSPFEAAGFDAIYAFSVFSHLPEALHLKWLAELARISKPGAALVLTTQGQGVADTISRGEKPEEFPKAGALRKRMAELERTGFLFFPYEKLRFHDRRNDEHFAEWDLEEYGATFILERYVRERWSEWFEVVDVLEAPDHWQDHVILRRR